MNVALVEPIVVNVPYSHREVSSIVARDGVTDILVRVTTDDGLVGWGEATSGSDAASVEAAIRAMAPFVVGRDPWNRDAMRADAFGYGLWKFVAGTGNFAWAGIDMALADICGKAVGPAALAPAGRRAAQRRDVLLLPRARRRRRAARAGRRTGWRPATTSSTSRSGSTTARTSTWSRRCATPSATGRACASTPTPAGRCRRRCACSSGSPQYDIDFVEQPVRETPRGQLGELRARSPIAVCANEGLWSEDDAYARIRAREADVYCFSPSWVGSLTAFSRLAHVAELEGLQDLQAHPRRARHHRGRLPARPADAAEPGRRAPADGADDGARRAHARRSRSRAARTGACIDGPGLGVEVDADAVAEAAGRYRSEGQYLPWQAFQLGREDRRMSGRLEGIVALVVGGGSGMGRAGAVAMANEGAQRRGRRHRPRARRGRGAELRRPRRSPSTSATPRASSAWSRRRSSASAASTSSTTAPSTCRS